MNDVLKQAKVLDQYNQYLPEVEIGDIVEINDIWDGKGDIPENSYSYYLCEDEGGVQSWLNYEFEVIEKKDNPLDTQIKITGIGLV